MSKEVAGRIVGMNVELEAAEQEIGRLKDKIESLELWVDKYKAHIVNLESAIRELQESAQEDEARHIDEKYTLIEEIRQLKEVIVVQAMQAPKTTTAKPPPNRDWVEFDNVSAPASPKAAVDMLGRMLRGMTDGQ